MNTYHDIVIDMKTISVAVSESVYEDFRRAARERDRSIAQLIREAMKLYRDTHLTDSEPLRSFPVFDSTGPRADLPSRSVLYDEMTADEVKP